MVRQPNWEGPRLACDLPIDRPGAIVHNELVLSGWAVSPVGISGVVVQIDDRLLHASYGLETPWVAEQLPEIDGSERAGFRLALDTSTWSPGSREITITAYDQAGNRGDVAGEVDVVPFASVEQTREANLAAIAAGEIAFQLELPSTANADPVESPVEVSGWAYAAGGIEAVLVTIDGRTRYEALRPIARPDLLDDYGEDVAAEAGFVLRLHDRDCPPGWRRLSVVAVGGGERRAVGVEVDVSCRATEPPTEAPAPGAAMPIDWLPDAGPALSGSSPNGHYDPEAHAGLLREAEHQLRYRLAGPLAAGRDVLDAGCADGWGTTLLADAEAASVVGLAVDEPELEAARARTAGTSARVELGDLAALPYDDASFDLVTCFETIERVASPGAALDELRRVLRADGVLLIAAPGRALDSRAGRREAVAGGLEGALRDRFANVRVHRQRTFLGSAVADDETYARGDGSADLGIEIRKLGDERPGGEQHTLVVAGDGELPELRPLAMLAPSGAVRRLHDVAGMWQDRALLAEADAAASRNQSNLARMHQEGAARVLRETETRVSELTHVLGNMRAALEDAQRHGSEQREEVERQAAELRSQAAELEQRTAELELSSRRLAEAEAALAQATDKIAAYDGSLSWRITRPLRAVRRIGRRGSG